MPIPAKAGLVLSVAIASFLGGVWWSRNNSGPSPAAAGRKILYYHDPMHPAYKSDKPGIAPDCGMKLEPVYADGLPAETPAASPGAASPPGSVLISVEKQQAIGVRVEEVRRESGANSIRVPGRTVADERRVYKVNSTIDGWVRRIEPVATTGSLVKKDETLATYNAPEFLGPMQAYLYALEAFDRFQATGKETEAQLALTRANIQQAKNSLLTLGMSELQANELTKTRQLTEDIRIVAPADGFIVARNISSGERFEKGAEFFRIADLRHVWVIADFFEKDRELARPGSSARVHYQGRTFEATMSDVLPQFDPASRRLKARFELDNPGSVLRPDMFVDVEFQVSLPRSITVPADALINSGKSQTVYVDRGNGVFEPRQVLTGWRFGNRVAITHGLDEGERVATGGNFLLDSESRLQLAAQGKPGADEEKDPVCGMPVKTATYSATYRGRTYRFCSPSCKRDFEAHPERFAHAAAEN